MQQAYRPARIRPTRYPAADTPGRYRSRSRRRKWVGRRGSVTPIRSLIRSVMSPLVRFAASSQAAVTARAVDAPCAITTVPPRPSSAAPP